MSADVAFTAPSTLVPARRAASAPWRSRPRRPRSRSLGAAALLIGLALALSAILSTALHLRLPTPTGPHAVGKSVATLTDPARAESNTPTSGDDRQIRLVTWYPAVAGSGRPGEYFTELERIRDGLVASGSIGSLEAAGLGAIADPARLDATPVASNAGYPVILLSPGNATNVESYGALATELASLGYVVIGLDHPFQSAAVLVSDIVAVYGGDPPLDRAEATTQGRIAERVADLRIVLDGLIAGTLPIGSVADQLDVTRVALVGHSNGGVASMEACTDARVAGCINMDGQLAGGPFSSREDGLPPDKPFLFLTKERDLHPMLAARFEERGRTGAYRVVVPAATHDAFTDGPMFRPRLLPTSSTADDVVAVTRGFVAAFLDRVLRGAPVSVFGEVVAPTDVLVEVYPLDRR